MATRYRLQQSPAVPKESNSDLPTRTTEQNAVINHSNEIVRGWLALAEGNPRPLTQRLAQWNTWLEVKIRISRMPRYFRTLDIYRQFQPFGYIQRIDIVDRRDGADTSAFVIFNPPPRVGFWNKTIQIPRATTHGPINMKVELVPPTRSFWIKSPANAQIEYPERMVLPVASIDFGFMKFEHTLMCMKHIDSAVDDNIVLTLDIRRQELDVKFPIRNLRKLDGRQVRIENYRFRISLSKMTRIYEVQMGTERRDLVIPLEAPPEFYHQTHDIEATHETRNPTWNEWRTWFRQTEVVEDRETLDNNPVRFRNANASIDIGRWITYRLVFENIDPEEKNMYECITRALTDYNVHIVSTDSTFFSFLPKEETSIWRFLDLTEHDAKHSGNHLLALQEMNSGVKRLPFSVRYQLEVCLSRGYLNEHNMTEAFLQRLAELQEEIATNILERLADMKKRIYDPMEILRTKFRLHNPRRNVPSHCALQRAATVTPTTIYYSTAVIETSNRVIRQYLEQQDRFLRVRFTDEIDKGRINSQNDDSQEEIFARITRALRNGITLGERHYEFLAFGNSQFREHGAYFFASFPGLTAQHIRSQLGDFRDIKVAAKFCARLGQNFSTTRAIRTKVRIRDNLDDIERNGFNFTDGVGKISIFLARMIASEFGLANAINDPPSVFQFRLGGCKGVLAVSPDVPAQEIHIRPSQYKFPAKYMGLEVIRTSQFVGATLNRQIIILLSSLGVRDKVFTDMLHGMLTDLDEAMHNRTLALDLLQKYIDFNQSTLSIATMILDGFMDSEEPFTLSLLRLWRSWMIKYLKEKARICVDKGACLLGCVDEIGVLKGHFDHPEVVSAPLREQDLNSLPEIFLQVDQGQPGTYNVIEGICILARNPSLYPGDVRVVQAVDKPELHHLKNVVVLPQTGDRDLASMCSGGDLDGDDYLVIWDENLIPDEWNLTPMDFTPNQPSQLDGVVLVEDITDFFVTYMKNDRLPKIAHAHLAWADFMEHGIKDKYCLELAQLHSHAVDYAKNGVPAIMSRYLHPKKWPHFMEKKHKPVEHIYQSKKVLGQLYDMVVRTDFKLEWQKPFNARILKAFPIDIEMLQKATKIKKDYDTAMRRIMAQHGIGTEVEVWSAFVLAHNQEKKDFTFAEELGRVSADLKEHFRAVCIKEAGGHEPEQLGPFIVAIYTVTACEVEQAAAECQTTTAVGGIEPLRLEMQPVSIPLMSFPWIFSKELGKLNAKRFRNSDIAAEKGPLPRPRGNRQLSLLDIDNNLLIDNGVIQQGDMLRLFLDAETTEQPNGSVEGHRKDQNVDLLMDTVIANLNQNKAPSLRIPTQQTTEQRELSTEENNNNASNETTPESAKTTADNENLPDDFAITSSCNNTNGSTILSSSNEKLARHGSPDSSISDTVELIEAYQDEIGVGAILELSEEPTPLERLHQLLGQSLAI